MHIIFFMIGVSLLIALGFLGAFIWSVRTGQQDDLYTPALRILADDDVIPQPPGVDGTTNASPIRPKTFISTL